MSGMLWQREYQNWAVWLTLLSPRHRDSGEPLIWSVVILHEYIFQEQYLTKHWVFSLGACGTACFAWRDKYFDFCLFLQFRTAWVLSVNLPQSSLCTKQDIQTGCMVTPCLERAQGQSCAFIASSWKCGKHQKLLWNEYCQALKGVRAFLCLAALEVSDVFSGAEAALGHWSCLSQGSRGRRVMLRPLASSRLRSSSEISKCHHSHSCRQWPEAPLLHCTGTQGGKAEGWCPTSSQDQQIKKPVKAPGLMGDCYDGWNIIFVSATWHFEPFCGKHFPSKMLLLLNTFHLVWGAVYTQVISLKRNRHPWLTVWAGKRSLTWWHLWNH